MRFRDFITAAMPYGVLWLYAKYFKRQTLLLTLKESDEPVQCSYDTPPLNVPPEHLLARYSQNGEIDIVYQYSNESIHNDDKSIRIPEESYIEVFKSLERNTFSYYGNEGNALLSAVDVYSLKDKNILIWGLQVCNCEALALWKGASKVYVVDYNKPICEPPGGMKSRIEVLSHAELAERQIKTDFAISYSSFEHDGLGRYGDPLDPDGDLRAMREAHNYLKDGGILFLGVPIGRDCLVFNLHRIYGPKRLPKLLNGWKLLDVFDVYGEAEPFARQLGDWKQNVLVLLKTQYDSDDNTPTAPDQPDEAICYAEQNRAINVRYRDENIRNQILKLL